MMWMFLIDASEPVRSWDWFVLSCCDAWMRPCQRSHPRVVQQERYEMMLSSASPVESVKQFINSSAKCVDVEWLLDEVVGTGTTKRIDFIFIDDTRDDDDVCVVQFRVFANA